MGIWKDLKNSVVDLNEEVHAKRLQSDADVTLKMAEGLSPELKSAAIGRFLASREQLSRELPNWSYDGRLKAARELFAKARSEKDFAVAASIGYALAAIWLESGTRRHAIAALVHTALDRCADEWQRALDGRHVESPAIEPASSAIPAVSAATPPSRSRTVGGFTLGGITRVPSEHALEERARMIKSRERDLRRQIASIQENPIAASTDDKEAIITALGGSLSWASEQPPLYGVVVTLDGTSRRFPTSAALDEWLLKVAIPRVLDAMKE